MLRFLYCCLCYFAPSTASSDAQAERRIALVIGNSAYQNTRRTEESQERCRRHGGRRCGGSDFEVFEGHDLDKRVDGADDPPVRRQAVRRRSCALLLCRPRCRDRRAKLSGADRCEARERGRRRFRRPAADAGPQADGTGGQDQHRAARCLSRQSAGAQPRAHHGHALATGRPGPGRGEDRRRHADRLLDAAGQRGDGRNRAAIRPTPRRC